MMLPRAVALAKATALPLPASPVQDTPREAPARSSGNAMVRECLYTHLPIKTDGVLACTGPDRHNNLPSHQCSYNALKWQEAPVHTVGNYSDAARGKHWHLTGTLERSGISTGVFQCIKRTAS